MYGTSPWEQGFNVTIAYSDGEGIGSDGKTYGPDSFTFPGSSMGVTNEYVRTPEI